MARKKWKQNLIVKMKRMGWRSMACRYYRAGGKIWISTITIRTKISINTLQVCAIARSNKL